MGVTAKSSEPVAKYLEDDYYCMMLISSIYCKNQTYQSREDEVKQVETYLCQRGTEHIAFDGGQFAQIPHRFRSIMIPFLYVVLKSLYWSKGKTLKYFLQCDDS